MLLAYPVRERKMRRPWLVRVSGEPGRRKATGEGDGFVGGMVCGLKGKRKLLMRAPVLREVGSGGKTAAWVRLF